MPISPCRLGPLDCHLLPCLAIKAVLEPGWDGRFSGLVILVSSVFAFSFSGLRIRVCVWGAELTSTGEGVWVSMQDCIMVQRITSKGLRDLWESKALSKKGFGTCSLSLNPGTPYP